MTVASMKKFQIVGHKRELDKVSYEIIKSKMIQLVDYDEFSLNDISDFEARPLKRENRYTKILNKISDLLNGLGINGELEEITEDDLINVDVTEIENEVASISRKIDRISRFKKKLVKEEERLEDLKRHVLLMKNMDLDLAELKNLSYISLIFGRVNRNDFERLIKNIVDLPILTLEVYRDEECVWFFTFTKKENEERAHSILDSVYYTELELPSRVKGEPREILSRAEHRLKRIKIAYDEISLEKKKFKHLYGKKLKKFYKKLKLLNIIDGISNQYYGEVDHLFIVNGWIPEDREREFKEKLENDFSDIIYASQKVNPDNKNENPPTVLRNKKWVKPFESLVELYGTPRYGEIDPSPFMAVTYLLIFGMMFGDVGQGLVFAFLGWFIYKGWIKVGNSIVGQLLISLGLSSTFFGFLFGSIFGVEHVLPALWIRPMKNIMFWLGLTIGFGVIMMIISMIFNLINSFRNNDIGEGVFSRHGLIGIFFYIFALSSLIFYLTKGKLIFDLPITVFLLVFPLILIMLEKPLVNLIKNKKRILPAKPGSYFLEAVFEVFDTLISYLSNTVSFVRIGAFTLNHIGLFMAVFMLADMIENSLGSILIIIAGNILIMTLEALVVAIQVLRLEFFELFGKFFKGDGNKFSPVKLN